MNCSRRVPVLLLSMLSMSSGCALTDTDGPVSALRPHLTFLASFDRGIDADHAQGDARLYTAPSYRELDSAQPGLGNPEVRRAEGEGVRGAALEFGAKNTHAIFYRAKDNIATDGSGLRCTIAFWLRLDPDEDLEPGYCDPIQITDRSFKDSSVWVDFTKDETPRRFRMGVFGALEAWNPTNAPIEGNAAFEARLVAVERPPFSRDRWHQVALVVDTPGGRAELYVDGESQGVASEIREAFRWELDRATIRVGINYVGLFDELMVFDRPLSADEVQGLFEAKTLGVGAQAR